MTKEEIISDLKFIIKNLDNIKKDAISNCPENVYPYAFGFITAIISQLSEETSIVRSAFLPEWEKRNKAKRFFKAHCFACDWDGFTDDLEDACYSCGEYETLKEVKN